MSTDYGFRIIAVIYTEKKQFIKEKIFPETYKLTTAIAAK